MLTFACMPLSVPQNVLPTNSEIILLAEITISTVVITSLVNNSLKCDFSERPLPAEHWWKSQCSLLRFQIKQPGHENSGNSSASMHLKHQGSSSMFARTQSTEILGIIPSSSRHRKHQDPGHSKTSEKTLQAQENFLNFQHACETAWGKNKGRSWLKELILKSTSTNGAVEKEKACIRLAHSLSAVGKDREKTKERNGQRRERERERESVCVRERERGSSHCRRRDKNYEGQLSESENPGELFRENHARET